jgi:adenosylhomocysteinase
MQSWQKAVAVDLNGSEREMPVLRLVRERLKKENHLKVFALAHACTMNTETANLMRTLQAGGADLVLTESNRFSTQDDVELSW